MAPPPQGDTHSSIVCCLTRLALPFTTSFLYSRGDRRPRLSSLKLQFGVLSHCVPPKKSPCRIRNDERHTQESPSRPERERTAHRRPSARSGSDQKGQKRETSAAHVHFVPVRGAGAALPRIFELERSSASCWWARLEGGGWRSLALKRGPVCAGGPLRGPLPQGSGRGAQKAGLRLWSLCLQGEDGKADASGSRHRGASQQGVACCHDGRCGWRCVVRVGALQNGVLGRAAAAQRADRV